MVLDRKKVTKKKSKTVGGSHESDNLSRTKRSSNGVEAIKSRIKEIGPICKSRKKYEEDDEGFKNLFTQVINQQESVWLASESLSPLYKNGDFMFTSPRDYPIDEQLSSESSTTSLSKCSESSSLFWDSDRTDLWVSLINLDGEDCKWISNIESDTENLESNFPSPTYANKSCSDVDVSSSMRSSYHDELSSELLSGSLDLDDVEFDEPLMWPFDDKCDWSYTSELFCQSPRRGFGSSTSSVLKNDDRRIVIASKFVGFKRGNHHRIVIAGRNTKLNRSSSSRNLIKMMLSTSKCSKKKRFRKGNIVMSAKRIRAMSLAGIDEFNWRSSSMDSSTTKSSSQSSSSSMDFDTAGLWVSLININEEDSQTRDELSVEILSDEMHADEPLFWPYAKEHNWSVAWDSFCASPRRDDHHVFGNPVSIRVSIHDQRAGFKRSTDAISGSSASKINRKAKGMNSRSVARKLDRNVAGKMDAIMENDVEGGAVEKILGLGEFDGHEGLDMKFRTDSFSILSE